MRRLCCVWLLVCLCGCEVARSAEDYRDAVATDLAITTMTDAPQPGPAPAPVKCLRCNGTGWITHGDGHRTQCPDCQAGSAGAYGSPLDTYRDAKALIAKGNALADRGKAILDAAESDGKIMLAVHLPKVLRSTKIAEAKTPDAKQTCPDGVCPYRPSESPDSGGNVRSSQKTVWHTKEVFWHRPRLLGRFRR